MNSNDSATITENKIHVKLSAENGKRILKNDSVAVSNLNEGSGDAKPETHNSYLSALSSTLKLVRKETNEILTHVIEEAVLSDKESKETKEIDDDDESSDEDVPG